MKIVTKTEAMELVNALTSVVGATTRLDAQKVLRGWEQQGFKYEPAALEILRPFMAEPNP